VDELPGLFIEEFAQMVDDVRAAGAVNHEGRQRQ
jgi:hypothetical protein